MKLFALKTFPLALALAFSSLLALGQNATPAAGPVFRLDGGDSTYAFGVNERGELQQIYWGGRIGAGDSIPPAKSMPEWASFDGPYNNTPQEYAGWGAGLYMEPALKVTFADGNRDLVLHYASSSQPDPHALEVILKDISRAITVTLHYKIDPETGILARSATVENGEKQPIVIEQEAAAAFSLPPAHYTLSYLSGRWAGEWTGAGKPARLDRSPEQPMVRHRPRRCG